MIEKGFYKMSNDEYHATNALSRSFMHRLLDWTPAHAKTPRKETPAMRVGQNFHTYSLEPDRAEKEFVTLPPDLTLRHKAGKEFVANAEVNGQTVLKPDELENLKRMSNAIYSHPVASELLKDGEPEISGFWPDPIHPEILCKIRMDWINKPKMVIVDLKKTTDARPHAFTRDAYKFGYDMEASWYLYGATHITAVEHKEFYFIACEDSEPWGVMVYKASGEMITEGLKRCAQALGIYKECLEKDHWPCYPEDVQELGLPGWVSRKDMVIIE